jgi:hypothetical protein
MRPSGGREMESHVMIVDTWNIAAAEFVGILLGSAFAVLMAFIVAVGAFGA